MIQVYSHSKAGVKFKALENMLAGSASPHAVEHWNQLFSTEVTRSGETDTRFVVEALQAGKIVVVFHPREWIFANHNENHDFVVLQFVEGSIKHFSCKISDTGNPISGSFGMGSLRGISLNDILDRMKRNQNGLNSVYSFDSDHLMILAVDKKYHYVPDCLTLEDDGFEFESLDAGFSTVAENVITGNYNQSTLTQEENKTMSNVKTNAIAVVGKNKSAALNVAKIEAGRIAIKQVSKVVVPKLPMMVRGYADTEIGRLVIANLFSLAVAQFASGNKNAVLVADAMLEGAMLETLQAVNFEKMINDVVGNIDLSKLTNIEE